MPTSIATSETNGVLTLTIQHPPVNTLVTSVRQGLLVALDTAQVNPHVRAVVITGAGTLFSAGADLTEFAQGTAMDCPTVHAELANALLRSRKPVVAAINGLALGGGLELAMWCHARVATADAKLGLPETTLGLMPGAGGTQLLPRAVGLARALDLIVDGQVVLASTLGGTRLLDKVCTPDELLPVSHDIGRALAATGSPHPHLALLTVDATDADQQLAAARNRVGSTDALSPGKLEAIQSVARCLSTPFDAAVSMEHSAFCELLGTPQAKAVRERFLSRHACTPETRHLIRSHST